MKIRKLKKRLQKWCKKYAKKCLKRQADLAAYQKMILNASGLHTAVPSSARTPNITSHTAVTQALVWPSAVAPSVADRPVAPHRQRGAELKNTTLSKKVLRKQLAHLLSAHLLQMPLKDFKKSKSDFKQQVTHKAALFIAANETHLPQKTAQIKQLRPNPNAYSFALRPYKKSPCAGCPALKGKHCRCALKRQPVRHAS
ncbi:MAG: hypothetical protein ACRC47_05530 [Shewanella sp.]